MNDTTRKPTQEQIADRAYQLYLERGAQDGNDIADWLQAEEELNVMTAQASQAQASQPVSVATPTRASKREVAAA